MHYLYKIYTNYINYENEPDLFDATNYLLLKFDKKKFRNYNIGLKINKVFYLTKWLELQ